MPKGQFMAKYAESLFAYSQGRKEWPALVEDFKTQWAAAKQMEQSNIAMIGG